MEEFDNCLFVIIKTLNIDDNNSVVVEQISAFLAKEGVCSFQESGSENFGILKDRIINNKGTIRQRKPDYFFYRLIDTVVDHYFIVLEYFEDQLELLEKKIVDNPGKDVQQEIYDLKSKMSTARKVMIPLRETISAVMKSDSELIDEINHKYFRDVYDHVIQIIDTLDSQRETVTDFLNLYMSGLSNKMNEVMKVLTIFAAIFIPLTFIAGIYGMNFEFMPELSWEYGYYITWGVMISVAITLLVYFRRKKWL
jgi:magnesium transporter